MHAPTRPHMDSMSIRPGHTRHQVQKSPGQSGGGSYQLHLSGRPEHHGAELPLPEQYRLGHRRSGFPRTWDTSRRREDFVLPILL